MKELATWATAVVDQVPRKLELFMSAYSDGPSGEWTPTRVVLSGFAYGETEEEAHELLSIMDTCPIHG